ncbi:MAG: type 2 lantipeptide synthetase LanM family protein, partial [Caldilineaceae bacterium]|nr:type 2 lantipeptide synthetase LanM family protein [Caldilineaceae bacterium]
MKDAQWFASALWYHALALAERNALWSDGAAAALPPATVARGRQRLERWQAQPPFAVDPLFAQRLACDGIDPERLPVLLGEPVESLQARIPRPPAWLTALAEAFARPQPEADLDAGALDDDLGDDLTADDLDGGEADTGDEAEFGFLELVRPLIDQACDRLQAGVAALAGRGDALPFDPATVEDVLLMNLPDPLLMRMSRTLVLELHVARLQGLLEGDTPEARFDSFVERLRRPDVALAILAEYPILARQLTLCLDQWVAVSLEFLARLCADWDAIRRTFSPGADPGLLVELAGGAGDTHRDGRSVMIAAFESGFRLVYKPKSLAVDVHFQELLGWLNRRGCQPPLYTLAMLDRGEYGWVEFVARRGCDSRDEVARFYQRHGAYLALLYALNSNDFHYENLIAVGEEPVLIDLETLLQPQFDRLDTSRAGLAAEKVIADSVMQVNLLPLRMWSSEGYTGIDISGLGGAAGQLSPDRLPQLTGSGTDAMRYERRRIELSGDAHRPTLDGAEVDAAGYLEEVVAGFARMYRLLTAQRAHLLADDGPLRRFAQDEIRVLLRPTRTYDQLLSESFHPDMLRDALERDRFLDRLWVAVADRAYLAHVIPTELADLHRGDIPIFTTRPASLELFGASGVAIGGVLYETGETVVRRRFAQLSEADLERQVWFIRASFATLAPEGGAEDSAGRPSPAPPPAGAAPVSRRRLPAGIRAVAERLAATAIHGEEDASWVGLEQLENQTWDIRSLGVDLYGGIPGVALFLAYAGALLGEERYTALARRAVNTLRWQVDLLAAEMPTIGVWYGWGGVLYAYTHLAALWHDPDLLAQAAEVVDALAAQVAQDDTFDIARGSAGAILALLAFHRHTASDHALAVACACGDHLLGAAQTGDQGLGWALPGAGAAPPAGLAHGVAGIAWALLELAAATGLTHYRDAAQQAIERECGEHERNFAAVPTGAQSDLGDPAGRPLDDPVTALPRGLAYWGVSGCIDTPWLRDALRTHLQAAVNRADEQPSALQGAMGVLDLLMLAGGRWGDDWPHPQVDELAARLVAGMARDGRRCATPQAVEVPGLMLGLAGIGYQLLRLAEPARVPSVLALAPPPPPGERLYSFRSPLD